MSTIVSEQLRPQDSQIAIIRLLVRQRTKRNLSDVVRTDERNLAILARSLDLPELCNLIHESRLGKILYLTLAVHPNITALQKSRFRRNTTHPPHPILTPLCRRVRAKTRACRPSAERKVEKLDHRNLRLWGLRLHRVHCLDERAEGV